MRTLLFYIPEVKFRAFIREAVEYPVLSAVLSDLRTTLIDLDKPCRQSQLENVLEVLFIINYLLTICDDPFLFELWYNYLFELSKSNIIFSRKKMPRFPLTCSGNLSLLKNSLRLPKESRWPPFEYISPSINDRILYRSKEYLASVMTNIDSDTQFKSERQPFWENILSSNGVVSLFVKLIDGPIIGYICGTIISHKLQRIFVVLSGQFIPEMAFLYHSTLNELFRRVLNTMNPDYYSLTVSFDQISRLTQCGFNLNYAEEWKINCRKVTTVTSPLPSPLYEIEKISYKTINSLVNRELRYILGWWKYLSYKYL